MMLSKRCSALVKRTVEVSRFRARSNLGREYTVIQFQDILSAAMADDAEAEKPGLTRLRTSEGYEVTPREVPGTYFVMQTREVIKKA
jgi:hypothetical protein